MATPIKLDILGKSAKNSERKKVPKERIERKAAKLQMMIMDSGVEPDGKAGGCRREGEGAVQSKDKADGVVWCGVVVLGMVLGGVGCRWW